MNTKQSQQSDTMELSTLDFSKITLPVAVGGHAAYNGCPCEFMLSSTDWFQAPFGANDFKKNADATRLSVEFLVSPSSVLPTLQQLDQAILQAAIKQKIFPSMSDAEVASSYHSLLAQAPKYNQVRLRTKMNLKGLFHVCRFWKSPERTRLNPESVVPYLSENQLRPHCRLQTLWQENGKWGVTVELLNLLVKSPEDVACPF